MNAVVYCFVSAKGGSGKTSIAANIATFVMTIGQRCLLVDCDPATHGMTLLYLSEVSERAGTDTKGLFDLDGTEDLTDVLSKSVVELDSGAHLFPASYRSEIVHDPVPGDADKLAKVVEVARGSYDVVILDAQAGTDTHARAAMSRSVSDQVVIVSEYDPLSAAGVEMMKRSIGDDLGYARTWILLNKILPEFVRDFGEFLSVAKYLPPVPWDIDVVRAYAKRQLAFDPEGSNDFTLALIQTSRRLLESVCREEIEAWMKKKAYELKAPIMNELRAAQEELELWKSTQQQSVRKSRLRTIGLTTLASYAAACLVVALMIAYGELVYFEYSSPFVVAVVTSGALVFAASATAVVLGLTYRRRTHEDDQFQNRIQELEDRVVRLNTLIEADDEIVIRESQAAKE